MTALTGATKTALKPEEEISERGKIEVSQSREREEKRVACVWSNNITNKVLSEVPCKNREDQKYCSCF